MNRGAKRRMGTKEKNKGFSLVELIVVIAIMAILAVALAPRFMHYLDKARKGNDQAVVNTIATAVQTALADEKIFKDAKSRYGGYTNILGTKNASNNMCALNSLGSVPADRDLLMEEVIRVVGEAQVEISSTDASSPAIYLNVESNGKFNLYLVYNKSVASVTGTLATIADDKVVLDDKADYSVSK